MVSVRTIKMVMTGGWFMALFYPHYCPELQRTPKIHPVTTPRFNLAFVKLVNFEIITAVYNNKSPICEWFIPPTPPTYGDDWGIVYGIVLPTWVCLKIVYPIVPNGFADHYPVFKWLAIIGNINPTFSDKPTLLFHIPL